MREFFGNSFLSFLTSLSLRKWLFGSVVSFAISGRLGTSFAEGSATGFVSTVSVSGPVGGSQSGIGSS